MRPGGGVQLKARPIQESLSTLSGTSRGRAEPATSPAIKEFLTAATKRLSPSASFSQRTRARTNQGAMTVLNTLFVPAKDTFLEPSGGGSERSKISASHARHAL